MSVKVELKCTRCDKRSVIPKNGVFPKHHPVYGTGYFGKRINRRVDCEGSGVDSRERVLGCVEQVLAAERAYVARVSLEIETLRGRLAEAETKCVSIEASLAKLRGAK